MEEETKDKDIEAEYVKRELQLIIASISLVAWIYLVIVLIITFTKWIL